MAALVWTSFPDKAALSKRELRHEWRELIELLQNAGPFPSKARCPWLKLARFGQARTQGDALRNDGNVLQITGVEGDYDGEQIQPEAAVTLLERAGLRAAVYTSPSHRADAPRWRVLAPLSQPADPAERAQLLARVNGVLGGVLTGESFTLSQSYYYGRVEGHDYRVLVTFDDPEDGTPVDLADELDAVAVGKPARANGNGSVNGHAAGHCIAAQVEKLGRRLRTGDERRELIKSYVGYLSNKGLSPDEIRTLLDEAVGRFFEPEDPPNWSDVNTIIADFTRNDEAQRAEVQATVGGFIASLPAKQEPAAVPQLLLSLRELEAASAAVTWAIKHVLPGNSVGMMFGAPGTFKSFIALDMALHIAHGMPWMGRKTTQGPVIYIAAEGGTGLWRRIKAWHQARGMDWKKADLYVVPVAVALRTSAKLVVEAAKAAGVLPVVVIVDTLSQTFTGEENSANDIADYLRALGLAFRALWTCAVMVIHHSGHSATERPRGSSAIQGNTDFLFGVFRDEKELIATVTCERQKDGELFKDEPFELTPMVLGKDADGDPITSLVARHISSAQELVAAHERQKAEGRGGRMSQLVGLAHNGMTESELRKAFYTEVVADLPSQDARKHAYDRARKEAEKAGRLSIVWDELDRLKRVQLDGEL